MGTINLNQMNFCSGVHWCFLNLTWISWNLYLKPKLEIWISELNHMHLIWHPSLCFAEFKWRVVKTIKYFRCMRDVLHVVHGFDTISIERKHDKSLMFHYGYNFIQYSSFLSCYIMLSSNIWQYTTCRNWVTSENKLLLFQSSITDFQFPFNCGKTETHWPLWGEKHWDFKQHTWETLKIIRLNLNNITT